MGRPPRHIRAKQISVRLDGDLLDALDERAADLGVDRSQLVTKLLKTHVTSNPYAVEENPGKYSAASPAKAERQPTADDTLPGTQPAG